MKNCMADLTSAFSNKPIDLFQFLASMNTCALVQNISSYDYDH